LNDFLRLVFNNQAVKKARKSALYMRSDRFETYQFGNIDDVQFCIYDKRAEMKRMKSEKWELMIRESIGWEGWASKRPITRVEIRLGRTALRCLGVNSVEDMLKRERGIIDLITFDWFRLLEKPKVRGRENKTKMHPLWERVRALFFQYFTGDAIRDVQWREPEPVSCDPTPLLKQAAGCIATAIAKQKGKELSPTVIDSYIIGWSSVVRESICRSAIQRAEAMGIRKGIPLGDIDGHLLEQVRRQAFEPILRLRR
jgi:hypothetical protein